MLAFKWSDKRENAAMLVAQDEKPDREIAALIGVSEMTLERWKKHPEFRARIDSLLVEIREAVRKKGIAQKHRRLQNLNRRAELMERVIDERARQHPSIDDLGASPAAGASTGLMVLTRRYLPGGGIVEEWAVDTGLLKELRETEKQAAQELGEWVEKVAPTDPTGKQEYASLSDDERAARIAAIFDAARKRRDRQTDTDEDTAV